MQTTKQIEVLFFLGKGQKGFFQIQIVMQMIKKH